MSDNDERKVFFQKHDEPPGIDGEKQKFFKFNNEDIDPTEGPISLTSSVKSVTILGSLIDKMTHFATKAMPKEVMGLLGGKEMRPHELTVTKILYVSEGDEISVSFSEEDFDAFEKILDIDSYCLGWWHSHPRYGLFLSNTDISTHIYSFQLHNEQSIALVIEPSIIEANGRAAIKCYQVAGEQGKIPFDYVEIAIFIHD
jgi:26S proteasome regulatory subunit N11